MSSNTATTAVGGIHSTPEPGAVQIVLRDAIVSGNTDAMGTPDCLGELTSEGHNLLGETSDCPLLT